MDSVSRYFRELAQCEESFWRSYFSGRDDERAKQIQAGHSDQPLGQGGLRDSGTPPGVTDGAATPDG